MAPSLENPGDVVVSPIKLSHVVLRTNRFDTMIEFYKVFLGAHVTFGSHVFTVMTYDDEHHRIGILHIPNLKEKDTTTSGLEHIAFTYQNLNDLAMGYLQRKQHNIIPFGATNHGPTTSIYYRDPDGNMLETQVDNFETVEETMAFLDSGVFQVNPIGVDFEPDDLVRRLRSGEDHASIKKRVEIGARTIESVVG